MSETIGSQLKQARLNRNLSIAKVAQMTRIRAQTLEALEADDFESIPSAAQLRGFLRIYAEALGLSLDEMTARQDGTEAVQAEAALLEGSESTSLEPEVPQPPDPEPAEEEGLEEEEFSPVSLEESQTGGVDPLPAENLTASQVLFHAIGSGLKNRRESLGLALDEIEQHTRIRGQFLEALESGEFENLASPVQVRGMLSTYGRFLDMDVDSLLLEFADGLQRQLAERKSNRLAGLASVRGRATRRQLPVFLRTILSPDLLVGGGLLVLLLVFAVWGTGSIIRMSTATTPQPTAPSISDILLASPPAEEATATGMLNGTQITLAPGVQATLEVTLPAAGAAPVQIVLVASRSAWVKVVVDGKLKFEGRLGTGTAYTYEGSNQIEVVTGDGAAISVIYNQSNMGVMGSFGEVVDRIYTTTAILSPTVTSTPTASITPTPTLTLRPSATPRFSSTPRVTPTEIP